MKCGKHGHQVGSHCYILSRRYDARRSTYSRWGVFDPSLICMMLDSLEYLADIAVLQVEDPFDHCVH